MLETKITTHVPLPLDTRAFYCGNCGAVALDAHNVCNPKGRMQKKDWCGSKDRLPATYCRNRVNNDRFQCEKCGKTAINAALLCEPRKLPVPE
ncbi:MAG: hypothetical protein AB1568_14590 [Thermodesulfobacteriota bacterium]